MGFLTGSRFNLVVSLRYIPVAGEMPFWCTLFDQVSRIISDSTDGVLSIGQILISPNSMGGKDADIWIHPNSDVWSNSTGARLWFPFESLDVPQDHMIYPTILAHELAHYLYDVRDEYNNGSTCQGNIATEASLMEGYGWENYTRWVDAAAADYPDWVTFFPDFTGGIASLQDGQPSEFCHAGNHNTAANNNQNNINGMQSCWTYMANDTNHNNIPYGLVAPAAGGPALAAPGAPPAVVCTQLTPVQRFVLVLDRSGSMSGAKIQQLKVGANFWVDYVNEAEELGVISYATTETVDVGRSAVPAAAAQPAWRTARHSTVDGLTAAGQTAIGDALRAGLNEITAGGRASSQVIILFTDGLQNAGAETAQQVLPDLRAAGVRVYTVGLGSDQDATLLTNIAQTTGATYFPISGALPTGEAATAITEALVALAGESRENGGIVSFNPIDAASPDPDHADEAPPFDWRMKEREQAREEKQAFKFSVPITEGSQHATLGALWTDQNARFDVAIFDPSGNPVPAGPGVRQVGGAYPYGFYEVDNPQAGDWTVVVEGAGSSNIRFRTVGFEVNNRISLDANLVQAHVPHGSDIEVRARLRAPFAVPDARILAWVLTPNGDWMQVSFDEHTGAPGDPNEPFTYTATIPTGRSEPGQFLIVVDAWRPAGTFDVKLDELYRQRPGLRPEDMVKRIEVPNIRRRALLAATSDREGASKEEPIVGYNEREPVVNGERHTPVGRYNLRDQA
jgi:uncharacterized protein YegL